MLSPRVQVLVDRLEKGARKTNEIFGNLTAEQWHQIIFDDPEQWTWRDLLAHFVSAEEKLLELAQNAAAGGEGAPAEFDLDAFNAEEHARLHDYPPARLLAMLELARQETLDWVATLNDKHLDYVGRHPALGVVSVEAMVTAIYGHQLLHMREVQSKNKI
jgi:hypothetical protein